ncbi:MAG: hypothetical protein JO257_37385 [Deltaproteobacteria bacterium]|nr:hypothetical protein [Deltaproteobacteria bacterium]
MKTWRNLPPALLAMFVIELLSLVVFTTYELTHSFDASAVRFDLTARGFWLAADVLGVFGALALARRLAGSAATGFRIVAAGFALSLAGQIVWDAVWMLHSSGSSSSFETLHELSEWSWFVLKLIPLAGIAVATASTHRRIAVAAVVAIVVCDPAPFLSHHMWGWVVSGWKSQMLLFEVLRLASLAVLAVGSLALAPEPYPAPPTDAVPGFHAIASGLWLRVIAACTFAGLMLLLLLGKAGDGAMGVFKLATISVAVVNAISFLIVARGALTTLVRDMPGPWMLVAGIANLWCLGVTLGQLPSTYEMLYGDSLRYGGADAMERAQALSIIAPLVAVGAVAAIAIAIAGFAATRGLEQLRAEAQGKGLGFVCLMVAAIGIQQWLLPQQTSEGSMMFFMLTAAGCSLGATVMMARLCTRAADSLHAETALPTATLRS